MCNALLDASDFAEGLYTVQFNEGSIFPLGGCITIPTTADDVFEGFHAFSVNISGTTLAGALLIAMPSETIVTITDDGG